RVAQAMGGVFAVIGTPTRAPKPRGKSPGWQPGKKRLRKNRCPIVKKNRNPTTEKTIGCCLIPKIIHTFAKSLINSALLGLFAWLSLNSSIKGFLGYDLQLSYKNN
ncbi:hypothetical protein ACE1AT_19685, partial [Pelatocladus sp. BLCC-F211]